MLLTTALLLAGLLDAPVSLTTSDGNGLKLVALDADAVCGGPLCFTELRLSFENPEDRVIEGQFQAALPPGASVSRFAMKIGDAWQEAEVVEKQAARRAYDDFLHRRQDPALLEQAAGNQFQARVFPIPARGTKELIISWGHAPTSRDGVAHYVFPLAGLPQVDHLKVRVRNTDGKELFALDKTRVVPNVDVDVDIAKDSARAVRASLDGGNSVVVMRAAPTFKDAAPDALSGLVVLIDTSASRALQMAKDIVLLKQMMAAAASSSSSAASTKLVVLAFDQTVQEVYRGTVAGFDAKVLSARRPLGATDLGNALDAAAAVVSSSGKSIDRVVVISDGVGTADLSTNLAQATAALKAKGVRRIDAVVRGGVRDEGALRGVVKGGSDEGLVVDGDRAADDIVGRLLRKVRSGITVDVKGATSVWPKVLDGVQPGDERVIVAELKAGAPLVVSLGGRVVDVGAVGAAPAPLLQRAWAEARLARLQAALDVAKSPGEKKELNEQMVAVSTRNRVLCSQTALLVLETEADYSRYGIARKALADILVVDNSGLSLRARKDIVAAASPPPPPKKLRPSKAKAKVDFSMEGEADAKPGADMAEDDATADKGGGEESKEEAEVADESDAKKMSARDDAPAPQAPPPPPPPPAPSMRPPSAEPSVMSERRSVANESPTETFVNPWNGPFDDGMKLLKKGDRAGAIKKARAWREEQPGDVLALLLLAEALGDSDVDEAGRALGSIIDLFPARTDLRRAVGARLDQLNSKKASKTAQLLAIDTWRKSVEQRTDHPQSHRGLAYSLVRAGRAEEAFAVVENALKQTYRSDSFRGVDQILREDLGLIGAAWKAKGGTAAAIAARIKAANGTAATGPSLRFTLWWETDANDVDFHIRDKAGNHAYYSEPNLASGGNLYADVTTGYGPECFTIPGAQHAYPYALSAHYYSRGPMGFGLGTMMVIEHDGKGGLRFDDRPFVIMVDGAFVDLGVVKGPL